MTDRTTIGLITIGDEVLSHKVQDVNTPFVIEVMSNCGLNLRRVAIVPDQVDELVETIRDFAAKFDLVITSGGVGPTHDDVTMQALSVALNSPVEPHPELVALLETHYPEGIRPGAAKMTRLPKGSQLRWAEGLRWPIVQVQNIAVLPGVPALFQRAVEILASDYARPKMPLHEVKVRVGESEIAPLLAQIDRDHPAVAIGSYPQFEAGPYRVRITLESDDTAQLRAASSALVDSLPADAVVDVSLEG